MPLQFAVTPDGEIRISGAADVHVARELYDGLAASLRTLQRVERIRLDLSDVTELDTSAAQTLIAFRRTAGPGRVSVAAPSALVERMRALGLTTELFT